MANDTARTQDIAFADWSKAFSEFWKETGMMLTISERDRRYYYNFGYSPNRAVDICMDVG